MSNESKNTGVETVNVLGVFAPSLGNLEMFCIYKGINDLIYA